MPKIIVILQTFHRVRKEKINKRGKIHIENGCVPLQVQTPKHLVYYWAYKCTSLKKRKASISLEASIALSVFLMVFLLLFQFFFFIMINQNVEQAMAEVLLEEGKTQYLVGKVQEGLDLSGFLYAKTGLSKEDQKQAEEAARKILDPLILGQKVKEKLRGKETLSNAYVGGLHFLGTKIDPAANEMKIQVNYIGKLLFVGEKTYHLTVHLKMYGNMWMGKSLTQGGGEETGETEDSLVYVTETGSVYHTSRGCSHLNLTIRSVDIASVGGERNKWGSRYNLCPLCRGKEGTGSVVYITEDGENYHYQISCSGLKRTIRQVHLSEVAGMPKCKDCP